MEPTTECLNEIKTFIKTNIDLIIKKKYNGKNVRFIGKGGQGVVYLFNLNENCKNIVAKISKKTNVSVKEASVFNLITKLPDGTSSPNIIKSYGNLEINNYICLLMEKADGSLEDWIKVEHSFDQWKSLILQILLGVLFMQKILKMYHGDMKPKNILFKSIPDKTSTLEYDIDNKHYSVKTYGIQILISDFGTAQTKLLKNNILTNNEIDMHIKNNLDLEHLITFHKRIIVNLLENVYSYDDIIELIKEKQDKKFKEYLDLKTEETFKTLHKYPDHIKKAMILRSLLYYMLEHKYINVDEIPVMINSKPPPQKIVDILENIILINQNKSIEQMIQEIQEII